LDTTRTPRSIIHGDSCFAYFCCDHRDVAALQQCHNLADPSSEQALYDDIQSVGASSRSAARCCAVARTSMRHCISAAPSTKNEAQPRSADAFLKINGSLGLKAAWASCEQRRVHTAQLIGSCFENWSARFHVL
jgi:hypothetical protein